MKCTRWSLEEIELLKELYPYVRMKDLANKFPRRNYDSVIAKALSLNLPSVKLWHLEANQLLKKHFVNTTEEELLSLFPTRSWKAIRAQGERLGLKRKTDKPRLAINENYFKEWNSNMAYILGFILADGCIIKGTYKGYSDSLKFGVQLSDVDILEKIKKEFNSGHKITIIKNVAYFCVSSQIMVNDLKRLGISYRKSLNEVLPDVPVRYWADFIRGIIDGDGGISIDKKGQPSIGVCGGGRVVTFIRDHFFNSMGLYSTVGRRTYSEKYKNFLYDIRYRSNTALKIIKYLYNSEDCMYLNRKYRLARQCMKLQIKERIGFHEWKIDEKI